MGTSIHGNSSWARIRPAAAALVLLLGVCCVAHSQDRSSAKLSLRDAVAKALRENASLKQAEERQVSSVSRLRIASITTSYGAGAVSGWARTPSNSSLSGRAFGSVTYEGLFGTQASLDISPFAFGSQRAAMDLTLRHPLTSGRGRLSRKADIVAGARTDASIQAKQLYLTRQAKILDVVDAYFQAVLLREQVKVEERAVAIAEEAAEGARKRAEAGLVPEIDVSRAEIRVAQTKDQLNLRRQSSRAALDRLMLAIGAGVGERPELTDAIPKPSSELPALADAVEMALRNRLELAVFDARLADQARALAIAKDTLRARLDAVASLSSHRAGRTLISGSFFDDSTSAAGIEYRFPIDRRVDLENRDIAERGLEVLARLRTFQMEEIAEQVRDAHRRVQTASTSMEILTKNVEVAKENLAMAQRMVDEGLADNRDVLDAQAALTSAESGLLAARTQLYLARVNLEYAMGEDLAVFVNE